MALLDELAHRAAIWPTAPKKKLGNERELSKISWVFLLGSLAERFGEFILDRFDRLTNHFLCLGS